MITKNDVKSLLNTYDKERSIFRVGFFSAALDYFTTPFYYELKSLYTSIKDSADMELSPEHVSILRKILGKHEVDINSTNDSIVNLYNGLNMLVRLEAPNYLLRSRNN